MGLPRVELLPALAGGGRPSAERVSRKLSETWEVLGRMRRLCGLFPLAAALPRTEHVASGRALHEHLCRVAACPSLKHSGGRGALSYTAPLLVFKAFGLGRRDLVPEVGFLKATPKAHTESLRLGSCHSLWIGWRKVVRPERRAVLLGMPRRLLSRGCRHRRVRVTAREFGRRCHSAPCAFACGPATRARVSGAAFGLLSFLGIHTHNIPFCKLVFVG